MQKEQLMQHLAALKSSHGYTCKGDPLSNQQEEIFKEPNIQKLTDDLYTHCATKST